MGYTDYEFNRTAGDKNTDIFQTNVKADNANRQYKYAVQCTKCGKIIYRKTWSKLISNPERFLCGSCNGELKRIKI